MISETLSSSIRRWLDEARARYPTSLSRDGRGVMIYGDVGGAAYIYADGTVVLEPWDDVPGNAWADPAFVTAAIVIGSKKRPELRELLPTRPTGADDCPTCLATGSLRVGSVELTCTACRGLGWRAKV